MKRQKFSRAIIIIGLSLVIAGSVYLILPALRTKKLQAEGRAGNQLSLEVAHKRVLLQPIELKLGTPVGLSLPRLSVDKEVQPGFYNKTSRTWTLDGTHAFYMTKSSTPIIYGHDTNQVFRPLDGVADNEILKITNSDGEVLLFRYSGDENISPSASDIISTFKPNTILLITCSGIGSQTRRVLTFDYLGIDQESLSQKTRQST